MMSDIEQHEATPFAELERQMLDTNFPKNEREWWSWREINNLRDTITRLTAEVERLRAECQSLAAWVCVHPDGKTGIVCGEGGSQYCAKDAEIERLRAALRNVLSYVPHGDMPVTIYDNARAALAEEKPHDR